MVKILNCYLYAKESYGTLSKGAIFFGHPCSCEIASFHSVNAFCNHLVWIVVRQI